MEIFRCYISLLFCLFSYNKIVSGFSCDYAECTCMDDMITCVGVTAPRFKYRATVTMLCMDAVQVVNLLDVIKNLPNLKYLSLMNMKYFNCKWLKEINKDLNVRTNMCLNSSSISQYSSTRQPPKEKRVTEDKLSKQIDEVLSTSYWSKFNSVTEISEGVESNQIREEIDRSQSDHKKSNNRSNYNEELGIGSANYSEYPPGKISTGKYRYFWWISLTVLSCIVVAILIISILYLCRKKFIRRLQGRNNEDMDDSAVPLSQCPNEE